MFEDHEAVIKMIIKGRSPTMRHVSRTHRVALAWLFDRINLDSKIQMYIDTKNQLADILTKGNFTRDEWNHLLNLFNISHFSSTACTAAMAKRAQQEPGEERVTAKSRPMMNLTARTPSFVSSSASSNSERTSYGYQDPGKSVASDDRSGKPDRLSRTGYSEMDYGLSRSSQEWKSEVAEQNRVAGVRVERSYRDCDAIHGESIEFEWNIFPGSTTLQLCDKVNDLLSNLGQTPGRILSLCQCSMTFLVTEKAIKKNVWQMPES